MRARFFALDRLDQEKRGQDLVVIVGSSKTKCAVDPDGAMTDRLKAMGRNLRFVRITRDQATAADFPELFAALIKAKPRLLLLETDLLVFEPNVYRPAHVPAYRDWRQGARDAIEYALAPQFFRADAIENSGTASHRPCRYGGLTNADARRIGLSERRASVAAERAPYIALIRALRRGGSDISLVSFPKRPDALGRIPAGLASDAEHVERNIVGTERIGDMGPPPALGVEAFEDPGHLKPQGRNVFSQWLTRQIAARVPGAGA